MAGSERGAPSRARRVVAAGRVVIGLYIGKAGVGSAYGAAGSLVILLVWVYYSAQIFLFGAEFTHAYAQRRKSSGK